MLISYQDHNNQVPAGLLASVSNGKPVVVLTSLEPHFTVVDFMESPYSPEPLLPVTFDTSITASTEYREGCRCVFFHYQMFFEEFCTWSAVARGVVEEIDGAVEDGISLAWAAGFEHGILSELALTDRSLALKGLDLLVLVVSRQLQGGAAC
jgi:hypothetical protein